MNFSNDFAQLDKAFCERAVPVTVKAPQLFLFNHGLADRLMIPDALQKDLEKLAQIFSGNRILPGSEPVATVYAGHQFGNFVPRLGDGRAHLLGEVADRSGKKWDIQLKGSGPTVFSRGGDGRCAMGPAVREFIMSEAMHALGVPTTRCLAVVTTGEAVFREKPLPGAVVTRVASSHMRIGTFQYFAATGDTASLKKLCAHAMARHDPDIAEEENPYALFLDRVMTRQIQLVVEWMRVGFIHGVMNTDNTAISGETIDYGPCAMMGVYDPGTVYSSIDTMGRYAYGSQPKVLHWNLARLAECLLPLIHEDRKKAVDQLEPVIAAFPEKFQHAYMEMMAGKLGLATHEAADASLVVSLLDRLKQKRLDYTLFFDRLTRSLVSESTASETKEEIAELYDFWQERLAAQGDDIHKVHERMQQHNPVVIPRNHHMEAVLEMCQETGEPSTAEEFLQVLASPYKVLSKTSQYQDLPKDGDRGYQTFCGT